MRSFLVYHKLNVRRHQYQAAEMIHIAHIADVHISDKRREEYAKVFSGLYASLRKEKPNCIVVAGDLLDIKAHASPENMKDVIKFMVELSKIAYTLVIPGNHDTDCNKPGALDLLTPLIEDHRVLQPPQFTYWRNSGTYAAHGIVWTVKATDGPQPSEESEQKAIAEFGLGNVPHICLFHEEVNGALLPNNIALKEFRLAPANLARYDLALGGHIHRRQRFAPRAGYCGSLVQQDIGESRDGHGYVMWDIDISTVGSPEHAPHNTAVPKMREFNIPNPQGFVSIKINAEGRDVTQGPLPDSPLYWEVVRDVAAPRAIVRALTAEYTSLFAMPPRARRKEAHNNRPKGEKEAKVLDRKECTAMADAQMASRTLESHEPIIRGVFAGKPADIIDKVVAMHKARYHEPGQHAYIGARIRILRIEYEHFKCYGTKNVVDFTVLEKVVSGVLAGNSAGKSTFIEAIVFALYDVHPRIRLKEHLVRCGAPSCRIMLDFELDGKIGRIDKHFSVESSHSATSGRSVTNRYRFTYAGEDRTRSDLKETLREIREVVGSGEDALMSSFQMQRDDIRGFITASTLAARMELLSAALSIGYFKPLSKIVKAEIKEFNNKCKELEKNASKTVAELEHLCSSEGGDAEDLRHKIISLAADVETFNGERHKLSEAVGAAKANDTAAKAASSALLVISSFRISEHTESICSSNVAAWERCIGEIEPSELLESHGIVAETPALPTVPAAEQVRNAMAEMIKAKEREAIEIKEEHECAVRLAGAPQPKMALADANAAEQGAKNMLSKAQSEVAESGKPIAPTQARTMGPIPGATIGITDEINMPCPDETSVKSAIDTLSNHEPAHRHDLPPWNAAQYMHHLGIAQRGIPETTKSAIQITSEIVAARANVAVADQECAAAESYLLQLAIDERPPTSETAGLHVLYQKVGHARAWVAAAKHAGAIREQLRPEKGCAGCEHAISILDTNAIAEAHAAADRATEEYTSALSTLRAAAKARIVTANASRAAVRLKLQETLAYGPTLEELHEEKANAQTCVAALEDARAIEAARAAREVIAAANYHHACRARAWANHDERLAIWEAKAAHSATTIEHAAKRLAATRRAVAEISSATEAHNSANVAMQRASSKATAAREAVKQAHSTHATLRRERAVAIAALRWWRGASIAAKAAATIVAAGAAVVACSEAITVADRTHQAAMKALATAQEQASAAEERAKQSEIALIAERDRVKELDEIEAKLEILTEYKEVLSSKRGIGRILLGRVRIPLEHRLNEALCELGAIFRARIDSEFTVQITNPLGEWVPATSSGGYESFALGLAARLAIWRLAASPRPDAIIIDEGFTSCEEEKQEDMATAIKNLAAAPDGPRLLFIVSHLPKLKTTIERTLEIEELPSGSRITNSTETLSTVPVGPIGKARAAPTVKAPTVKAPTAKAPTAKAPAAKTSLTSAAMQEADALPPDPNRQGYVYCEVCDQSLTPAYGAKHPTTQKHQLALARKLKAKGTRATPKPQR